MWILFPASALEASTSVPRTTSFWQLALTAEQSTAQVGQTKDTCTEEKLDENFPSFLCVQGSWMNVPSSGKKGSKSPSFSLSQTLQGKCGCGLSVTIVLRIHRKLRICILNLIINNFCSSPSGESKEFHVHQEQGAAEEKKSSACTCGTCMLYVCLVNGW